MGKGFDYLKRRVVDFKLDRCCRVFPVRFGLLFTGYLDITMAGILLVAIADESFKPILMLIEEALMPDTAPKSIPILAYASELSFSVVLLCAIYRKDRTLLRIYQRYCIAAVIASVLVYSTVVASIGIVIDILLVISIFFQLYVLLLVRSMIVELKFEERSHQLPTVEMSIINKDIKEAKPEPDVEEIKIESSESDNESSEGTDRKRKLDIVEEQSKDESISEEDKGKK